MRSAWLVLLAASILLFGCSGLPPWERGNVTISEIPPNYTAPVNYTANGSGGNGTDLWGNLTVPNATGNATGSLGFAVPRSISDRIYEGQFDIPDPTGEPIRIYVINAGHADAVYISKGEFSMLIDDGNPALVNPYLKGLGVGKIDVLVATRDYPGATGGIADAMDEFSVGEFWDNGNRLVSEEYGLIRRRANESGIPVKHPSAGDSMDIGELRVYVLNPQEGKQNANPDNDAIALKVKNGEFCMILLNPLVQEWERLIISSAGSESLRCDVITYFKHGEGRTEPSNLIGRIAPLDAVISVGPNDRNLPSPTALRHLALQGIGIWRTDRDGTVEIVNYGNSSYDINPGTGPQETASRKSGPCIGGERPVL